MPVDVWGGMNQGLASLNTSFDEMDQRRREDERMARQARIDELQMPILKAQGEDATLSLEEKRRKITDLRAYDEARRELVRNPGTVPTTELNPEYKAPVPEGLKSEMTYAGEGNEVIPAQSAVGSPTMPGTRAPNPAEMAFKQMTLALQHGQPITDIATAYDLSDKLQSAEGNKITKFATTMKTIKAGMGTGYAKKIAPMIAQQLGIDPKMVAGYEPVPGGNMFLSPTGSTYIVDDDGKFLHEFKPVEPKSPSQIDVEIKAAQGDPLAVKIIKDQESRKARLKQIEAGSGGSGAGGGPYIPNAPIGIPGERNEAVLKGLTANEAATVKGLVDYRVAPLQGFVLKSPWGQKMIGTAQMYDPSFDYTQYVSRQKTKNDFTSGKAAANLRSLNTAVYHLDTLDKKLAALNNTDFPTYNEIANTAITAVGDKRVTGAKGAVTAVVSELAAVFKGMGATDQEINAWRDNFPIAGSRAQQKEAVNTGIELMFGRIKALESQYEGAMGRAKDFRFLSPESRKILKGLGADVDSIDEVAGTGTRSAAGTQSAPVGTTSTVTRVRRYNSATGQLEDAK